MVVKGAPSYDSSYSMFVILVIAGQGGPLSSEQAIYCRKIVACHDEDAPFSEDLREDKSGQVLYYRFEPRGEVLPGLVAADKMAMFNAKHTRAISTPVELPYDEVWVEKIYADLDLNNRRSPADKVADVSFTYWKQGRFVVSVAYAAADHSAVPRSVTQGNPSDLEEFTFKQIDGEWFVVSIVSDREWFEWQLGL